MLITNGIPPIHWTVAGVLIAAVTLVLLGIFGRALGVSTGLENLCGLVLRSAYFRRADLTSSRSWRLPFLGGLVLGGVVSAVAGGGWRPMWDLGMFDTVVGWGPAGKVAWMFAGGLLIGLGTRIAGGCTSGHGIFGNSNLQPASVVATLSFLASGIAVSALVYRMGVFG
ncbi:MAG: YeeE/YedE family protein [Phycisphaerales bacterium]|nr:YeeE/YedE family protein [Phycisphaerae bacterium]NNM25417.1 YeeE/YedE family protein [Phycisphaerales bacterium]